MMKKQTIEAVITAILLLVLVVLIVNTVRKTASKKGPKPLSGVSPPSVPQRESFPARPVKKVAEQIEQQKEREKTGWRRDPFFPGKKGAFTGVKGLEVTGIILDQDHPEETCAIIGNKVVKKGDSIVGAVVIDIRPEAVTVKKNGQVIVLPLVHKNGD